jgi:hypothetical protein
VLDSVDKHPERDLGRRQYPNDPFVPWYTIHSMQIASEMRLMMFEYTYLKGIQCLM